ncbi:MAG TPA: 23S rRNA (adenine(2503)-C(2))-methyltransferase RlmN, partial [Chthoniobacteraceae bacterium]
MSSPVTTPRPLPDLSVEELAAWLESEGVKPGHAWRILRRLLGANEGQARANERLPAGLEERLHAAFPREAATLARQQVSTDGTTKLLLRLSDGRTVESVLMPDYRPDRAAGCLSSQVGCAMGCDFCATTQTGFERNLTAGEIIEQFIRLRLAARSTGRALRTIVFMGMGEPLL